MVVSGEPHRTSVYISHAQQRCHFLSGGSELLGLGDVRIDCPRDSSIDIDRLQREPVELKLTFNWSSSINLKHTCLCGRSVGLSLFILRRPTPTAPEDTSTTRCPSLRSLVTVSTINARIERRGSWDFSSTMELVPGICQVLGFGMEYIEIPRT